MENVRIRTTNTNRFGKTIVTSFGDVTFDDEGIAFISPDNVDAAKSMVGIVVSPKISTFPDSETGDSSPVETGDSLSPEEVRRGLNDMTIAELRILATQHNISIPSGASKKADIVEIIFGILTK